MDALSMAGVALWRQLANTLEAEVRDGVLPAGARLPTEAALSQRFGVNRHTVRRAISELSAAGLVRAEQGRGTFVQDAVIDYPVGRRTRFSESLARQAKAAGRELLHVGEVAADDRVASGLGIRAGASVVLLELLGKADDRPISVASHFFPLPRFAGIDAAFERHGTVSAALSACGVATYSRRSTRVIARLADRHEQQLLALSRYRPVLVTESVNVDAQGQPIEVGLARMAADRVQLVFDADAK